MNTKNLVFSSFSSSQTVLKEIPVGSLIEILGGLIYFVFPVDLTPDVIPRGGYIDKVFAIVIIIKQVRAVLQNIKLGKKIMLHE
jgi:uncharacterized membrane protein YkvA (DUF1232 family)